jgi:hypothetical protein
MRDRASLTKMKTKKTNSMKIIQNFLTLSVVLLMFAGGGTSCNKETHDYVDCSQFANMGCESFFDIIHDSTASIIGKWQLVKSYSNWNNNDPRCIDRCQEKIVYEFRKNGDMIIFSSQYRTVRDSYSIIGRNLIFSLTPEHERFSTTLTISSEKLVITADAPTEYFVKIK